MMLVNIANDGPVTLELDSRKFEYLPITNQSNPAVFKALKAAAKNNDSKPKQPSPPPQREQTAQGNPGKKFSQNQGQGQQQEENTVGSIAGNLAETLTFEKDLVPENK
ncbi:hypothetical protein BGZ97_010646 [Linnemannia gamsii]|uniref:Uncharacterized protein n=1 Tax=Linnemannia gamsii TaxID=64522 RepID=A0A9P6UDN9_9FUNG|nr:hypothetical protein BGZ97_010646 [Linnemannia gamsii]